MEEEKVNPVIQGHALGQGLLGIKLLDVSKVPKENAEKALDATQKRIELLLKFTKDKQRELTVQNNQKIKKCEGELEILIKAENEQKSILEEKNKQYLDCENAQSDNHNSQKTLMEQLEVGLKARDTELRESQEKYEGDLMEQKIYRSNKIHTQITPKLLKSIRKRAKMEIELRDLASYFLAMINKKSADDAISETVDHELIKPDGVIEQMRNLDVGSLPLDFETTYLPISTHWIDKLSTIRVNQDLYIPLVLFIHTISNIIILKRKAHTVALSLEDNTASIKRTEAELETLVENKRIKEDGIIALKMEIAGTEKVLELYRSHIEMKEKQIIKLKMDMNILEEKEYFEDFELNLTDEQKNDLYVPVPSPPQEWAESPQKGGLDEEEEELFKPSVDNNIKEEDVSPPVEPMFAEKAQKPKIFCAFCNQSY